MKRLQLLSMLQAGFVLWVVLGALWGWWFPGQAAAGKAWITEALMLIMLGMGLTLRPEDVSALKHAGAPVLLGVFLQYMIMPLTAWLPVDPVALFGSVAQIVLLPVGLGVLIRRFWRPPEWLMDGVLPLIAMLAIAWIVGVVVGLNVGGMAAMVAPLVVAVVLLNVIGLLMGGGIAALLGQPRQRSRTVAIEVGMQNSGLAVALAMSWFSPQAALAGALFSLWHNVSGALLAAYWRRFGSG